MALDFLRVFNLKPHTMTVSQSDIKCHALHVIHAGPELIAHYPFCRSNSLSLHFLHLWHQGELFGYEGPISPLMILMIIMGPHL